MGLAQAMEGLRKIRVRYKYSFFGYIYTPVTGSFADLWKRYKHKYEFYCADLPPELEWMGTRYVLGGYKLDASHLEAYGKHKAWLDFNYTVKGKPVILVYNASM